MIIWKFPRSYFCVFACFVNMLNLKDIVFGGVYDMHETSSFWACDYLPLRCLKMVKSGNAVAIRVLLLNGLLVQATIVAKMVVCVLEWRFD